ncbi:MAG: hypothetical protein LBP50_06590 [Tannerella sp.]|jgi:hypothetical protein|nr:hypothetical protein [Tannerella sp.]
MDNHPGDWLYYIVILVVAIVSFISNLNKKKSQEQTLPPAPAPSMEEMLPPPPPPVGTQRKKNPSPVPKSIRPLAVSSLRGVEEGRRMLTGEAHASVEEKETAWMNELDLTDADAFRKAFIAAEVLNRKY